MHSPMYNAPSGGRSTINARFVLIAVSNNCTSCMKTSPEQTLPDACALQNEQLVSPTQKGGGKRKQDTPTITTTKKHHITDSARIALLVEFHVYLQNDRCHFLSSAIKQQRKHIVGSQARPHPPKTRSEKKKPLHITPLT